jgi:GTPase SAR1 family protein
MGVVVSKKIKRICSGEDSPAARILIVGLDSAGKSTLVQRFKNLVDIQLSKSTDFIEHITTEPTPVYQVETIYPRLTPLALNLWDLGGQEKARDLWRFYLTGVQGMDNLMRFKRNSCRNSFTS